MLKSRDIAMSVMLVATVISFGRAQDAELKEELRIYERFTQVGTVARRTFTSPDGLVRKVIYYNLKEFGHQPPWTESMLIESEIILNSYDDRGRLVRAEHYDGRMRLRHFWTITRRDNNRSHINHSATGNRRYEIRYIDNRSISHLYYDSTGKYLIGIKGSVLPDAELPFGWGPPMKGASIGIVIAEASTDDDMLSGRIVYVNVRNVSDASINIPEPAAVEFELLNSKGEIVSPRTDDPEGKRARLELHRSFGNRQIGRGVATYAYPAYSLDLQYGKLPAGRYRLRARLPIDDAGKTLVSNEVVFEVSGQRE
jgi:hypothetical protein